MDCGVSVAASAVRLKIDWLSSPMFNRRAKKGDKDIIGGCIKLNVRILFSDSCLDSVIKHECLRPHAWIAYPIFV